nr:MAG TPA: hypothetical protein [Caudoviricetes sp.]
MSSRSVMSHTSFQFSYQLKLTNYSLMVII